MMAATDKAIAYELQLDQLLMLRDAVCGSVALKAKTAIQTVAGHIRQTDAVDRYTLPGDDCAAFPVADGYQLLAMEGMLPDFVRTDPWHAGWSAVMANVSDIAAMGGRATAVVNCFWHFNDDEAAQIISGIKHACDTFGVTLAGGHTSIAPSTRPGLAVAILGFASKLLSCYHVQTGQQIYMVCDLNGEWHGNKPFWAVINGKKRDQIRKMWALLPELAEAGLIDAAKDISNAGVIGTLLMMLELNQLGAAINLEHIPRPPSETEWQRWLMAFQSYGFLLAGPAQHAVQLKQIFEQHQLTCQPIGRVTGDRRLNVSLGEASLDFWDLDEMPVTGFTLTEK